MFFKNLSEIFKTLATGLKIYVKRVYQKWEGILLNIMDTPECVDRLIYLVLWKPVLPFGEMWLKWQLNRAASTNIGLNWPASLLLGQVHLEHVIDFGNYNDHFHPNLFGTPSIPVICIQMAGARRPRNWVRKE